MKKNFRHLLSILLYPKAFLRFKHFGSFIQLGPFGVIRRPEQMSLGTNVFINRHFHISANNLTIGNNVLIGPNLLMECEDHSFNCIGRTMWDTKREKKEGFVTIEDDVWIGGNVVILKNVIIGEGAIIGAGSIVTKSLPPYSVSVGNPCRPIKPRFTADNLAMHFSSISSNYSVSDVVTEWDKHSLL